MEPTWVDLRMMCPDCKSEDASITGLETGSNANLRVQFACNACHQRFQWTVSYLQLTKVALKAQEEQKPQPGPVRPPLRFDDDGWLKAMGISGGLQ